MMRKRLVDYSAWTEHKVQVWEAVLEDAQKDIDNLESAFNPSNTNDAEDALESLKTQIGRLEKVIEECNTPPEFAPDFDPIPNSYFL